MSRGPLHLNSERTSRIIIYRSSATDTPDCVVDLLQCSRRSFGPQCPKLNLVTGPESRIQKTSATGSVSLNAESTVHIAAQETKNRPHFRL